jgi:hypothetical protein
VHFHEHPTLLAIYFTVTVVLMSPSWLPEAHVTETPILRFAKAVPARTPWHSPHDRSRGRLARSCTTSPRLGWHVGRPGYSDALKVREQYACMPAESRHGVGHRAHEWATTGQTEVEVVREMARCLRLIGARRVPEQATGLEAAGRHAARLPTAARSRPADR